MDINNVKDKAGAKINGLPFRGMVEKIVSPETLAKFPLLGKLIPYTNFIAVGLALALAVTVIASTGKNEGGGRATSVSDFKYEMTTDGKGIRITGYTGEHKRIIVPEKIEGYPVVEIWVEVFKGLDITIFDTVYYGAYNAEYIYIPDSVTEISANVFFNTPNLREVRLSDNITVIGGSSFQNSGVRKVNLPKALQGIRDSAFRGCGELTELIIPNSIQSVQLLSFLDEDPHNRAFEGCGKLPLAARSKIQGWGYKSGF